MGAATPTVNRVLEEDGCSTMGGQYGTCPESPSGELVSYVRYPEQLSTESGKSHQYGVELWVCDADLTDHRRVTELPFAHLHNGLRQQWVSEELIAVCVKGNRETRVIDVETGDVVHGPYTWYQAGHNTHDGKVLLTNLDPEFPEEGTDRAPGLYELDCDSGDLRLLVSEDEIERKKVQGGQNMAEATLSINHMQYSPNGERIAFLPDTNRLAITDAEGSSLEFYIGRKPMHFQWFDDDSIFGHADTRDHAPFVNDAPHDRKLYRWDITTRERVETLGGYGCHPAASPDRRLYATETWYHNSPVTLRLYERGADVPIANVFTTHHTDVIWEPSSHVNPSFSRDGSRLYYTKPVGPNTVQFCYTDVSDI